MTTADPVFRDDVRVVLNEEATVGGDAAVVRAARAVPPGAAVEHQARTLGSLLPLRHNSPLEHGLMGVYAELPGVVWWQLTRQRFMSLDSEDFSFNLESGRYKHLEPEFYVPPPERPLVEPDGFRPMRPGLDADADVWAGFADRHRRHCLACWEAYRGEIGRGVAREVARLVLPNWAVYCDGYVTAKPLTWLQFFSKRRRTADTGVPTFPQWEIERFAAACERLFAGRWPLTHAAFVANGRVAP